MLLEKHLPKPLGDVLGLCALYGTKSEANQQLVYRTIQQHADQLVAMAQMADSDINLLASVQALILLQIIRLLDGDIRQRANAENLQPFLVSSVGRLEQRMQGADDPAQSTAALLKTHKSDAWETWILAESIRRTVIMGHSLHGLYFFLKNGWDDSHHEFERLSFFGQGTLWCAQSRFEWESAVVKHHPSPIRFATLDSDMATIQPEEIEELGVIMMAMTKGVDEVCHWIGHQLLDKYGLKT
ncbi:hypothetical protein F53441_8161 [Fusarium austroafricanum]|uniref:Uncharacterized protein n=1 Tax=Fusarium austroafricanum TaxID=2364996 RepID=A0A8H4KFP8_9HYPO|nr:hypothetical protein F53441_8161 [Fusarium austroafricanum]